MESAETPPPKQQIVLWRPRAEAAFLPAALEIVETPASPAGRAVAASIIAFFVVGLAWACIGQVDIVATAPGRVIPAGEVKVIQPLETGLVRAIKVENGSQVKAGDVLVELDPTVPGADRERLAHDLMQAKLDVAEFTALKLQMQSGAAQAKFVVPQGASSLDIEIAQAATQARASEQLAKLASIDQQVQQKQAELQQIDASLAKLNATIPVLQEKERLRKELLDVQFGNKLAYLDAQQQLLDAVHDREIQTRRVDEISSAKKALERQREQAKSNYAVDILMKLAEAQQKVSGFTQEFLKAQQKTSQTELRSPIDGTVQQLSVHTVGGVVTPAQPLMVVVPRDRKLLVEAMVQNSDVGFVHQGQDVEVKVETFTFTRYGLLRGRVLDISQDAVTRGDPRRDTANDSTDTSRDSRQKSDSPAYIARVELDETSMMIDGQEQSLGPGMAVTAEIKTGRRTIIDYLLSPLVAGATDSLRER